MLRTEFQGSGSKLVISWDVSSTEDDSVSENLQGSDKLVERVNQLYDTISKFSTEFVQCMRQVQFNDDKISNNLNLSFKISDSVNEEKSSEILRLHQELDDVKNENRRLEIELKNKNDDLLNLEKKHKQDECDLDNKYQKEMSDLRIYFEKICHANYERDIVNNLQNRKNGLKFNSHLKNEAADESYSHNGMSFDGIDCDLMNKSKDTTDPDLKIFIVKAYNAQIQKFKDDFDAMKNKEMEKLKDDKEKYSKIIETLQSEVNRLEHEKALESKVKEIHHEVKEVYRTELDELQDLSDKNFLLKIKNDQETFENAIKRRFENALHDMNDEWESKVEILSELLIRESLKVVNLEENMSKMSEENESLKAKLIKCLEVFSADEEEANIEKIAEELKRMKEVRECENDKLRNENTLLLKKIEDLQQRIPPANSSREKVITALIEEITDLIAKEQLGECVAWPSELSSLERVFSKRFSTRFVDTCQQNQYACLQQLENYMGEPLNSSLDLNQLIDERDGLRKVNVALKGVINMFTRYLTKCEEGRDNTFIEALINAEKLKKNLDSTITDFETSTSCMGVNLTENDERKKVKFASNVSEFVNLLEESEQLNGSHDHSVSVTENDLKSWLQIVRNEASVVLRLISDQKNDVSCDRKSSCDESVQTASVELEYFDEGVQTDVSGEQMERDAERISFLQNCVQKSENKLSELNAEISCLKEYIKPNELIEGYGEANHAVQLRDRIPSASGTVQDEVLESDTLSESGIIYESDEYCVKCDKVKKEARKEIEDLLLQIRYLETKLEQNQKNLERHSLECDAEREEFEKEIKLMKDQAKDKERDIYLTAKEKFKSEIALFEQQVKDLNTKLEESAESRKDLEARLRSTEKRLKNMRDNNSELESKLAQSCESAAQLETKLKSKEAELKVQQAEYESLLLQLDSWSEMRVKQVEEFNDVHTNSSNVCEKMKIEVIEIEKVVTGRTRILENTYLPVVVVSSVLSSPSASEDISVADVVCEQRARLFSPTESDMSPPSRRPISFDVLSCLHEKLSKLFRAEDAAFKKIRDQEMQIAKINDELRKIELERDTINDSLRNTSSKLSQTKIEMENLQHGQYSYQSIAQLELTNKIRKLESQIKHYKKYLSQKDYYDAKVGRTMANMQALISNSNLDSRNETAENLQQLRTEFEEFEREKKRIQEEFDSLDAETDSDSSGTPRRKIRRLSRREAFTPADGKDKLRKSHVSFAENLESFIDSDVTRRAPAAVVSPIPRPASAVGNSSDKMHLLNISGNTSSFNLQPQKMRPNFDVERIPVQPLKNLNNDSINLNSDAFSSIDCNVESRQYTSSSENPSTDSQESELNALRNELEQEKQRHKAAVSKLLDFNNEKKSWKRREDDLTANNDKVEYELCTTRGELNLLREQYCTSEECATALRQELNMSNETINKLEQKLEEMECVLRNEVDQDKERRKSDEYCRAVVKERIGAELQCEQFSNSVKKLVEELRTEKSKALRLSEELEKAKSDIATLRETLQGDKELIETLTDTNRDLKTELERLSVNKDASCNIGGRTESLRDLAEKLQKEVELAVELDEHLYKNLESTSESSSLLLDLLKISPTLSQDVKKILFKLLRSGYQNLIPEDKKILAESFGLVDADSITDLRQIQEKNRHLMNQMENEKLIIADLTTQRNFLRSEVSRLETVVAYYDERMSFLVSKVDDYRNRYVKTEIELTATRCTCSQLESQIRILKKESNEVRTQLGTHAQKYVTENESLMKENLDLKQKIGTLKNQIEALTAELNSMKVISQYHSESENELSRSLTPLKSRLEAIQLKYCRAKNDLESARSELQKVKLDLKIEKIHNQQLEERHKQAMQTKREVEGKLIDSRMKLDNLMWEKQKVDDKLNAIELAEIRTRKVKVDKDNMSKKETELVRCRMDVEYTKLKENILKIKENFISLRRSWKEICERSQILYHRMLIAEKNQRCLVYQKNYLFIWGNHEPSTLKMSTRYKFKSVAIAVMSLRRLKFLSHRRLEHCRQSAVKYFTNESSDIKFYPWFDFIIDSVQESNHSEESDSSNNNEMEFLLIDDSLKALHQQYKNLLSKYD